MPKEILDIKKFLTITKLDDSKPAKDGKDDGKDKKKVAPQKKTLYIKTNKKITKFKLRGKKYLYTFKTYDKDKAQRLLQSIPATLNRVEIKNKKTNAKRKKK